MSAIANESQRIEAALFAIPADVEREQWWKVAAALKSEMGDGGRDLFDRWSQSGQSYNATDVRDTWKSTKAGGGIGIASLFAIAKEYGFDPRHHNGAPVDRAAVERRRAERERLAEAERVKIEAEQRTAAKLAAEIWAKAEAAPDEHPYLVRKKVKAHGLRLYRGKLTVAGMACDGSLIVPARDAGSALTSLEFVNGDGEKRFLPNGRKAGSYHAIGKPGDIMCVAKGYATAASIHEATGCPVAVAFDAGNLFAVADALKAKLPDVRLVICADDDAGTEGNPGVKKATAVACELGALLAVPDFGSDRPAGASDFNDLHQIDGLQAVRACIEAASLPVTSAAPSTGAHVGEHRDEHANPVVSDDGRETDEQAIARMAALKPMEYDRIRKEEAKRMGVQVSTLDKLVRASHGEQEAENDTPFADVEPWAEPVNGAAMLTEIASTVRRFIVCQPETAHATALWVVMTWCIDVVDVAPIAAITAPEKRCGKSQLLFLIGRLANRALTASNITPAALFRSIDLWHPTLLIDEADAFMRENEELRGLLNCGHTRESAYTVRVVGEDHTPKMFFVWGAKAIAGIGHLADTLMDRSIALELRRKLPHESVDKLRHAEPGLFDELRAKLARWADDNADAVRRARPALPDALHDRAQDNWEPLFQIAEVAGDGWSVLAERAALKLSGQAEQGQSAGAELLTDIKAVFDRKQVQRISMSDLLVGLLEDDEAPWKTWNRGREMTPRQLGKKLGEYGIKSKTVKIGYEAPKGFTIDQFTDAFARYLSSSADSPVSSVTRSPPNAGAGSEVTDGQSRDRSENPSVTVKPLPHKAGDRVTDGIPEAHGEENSVTDDEEEDV